MYRRTRIFTTLARGFAYWRNIAPPFESLTRSAQTLRSPPQSFTALKLRAALKEVTTLYLDQDPELMQTLALVREINRLMEPKEEEKKAA